MDENRMLSRIIATTAAFAAVVTTSGIGSADATPQPETATGTITTKTLTNAAGTRAYQVYTPPRLGPRRPLIAWLHGTSKVRNGDPMTLRRSNTLLTEADRLGFSVVAPMQSLRADPAGMWHFFEPASLARGQGETSILADILRRTAREQRADPNRVYAVGHSAGGGAVHVLGAVYSDLVAAIAISAGFPFLGDPSGTAVRAARSGRRVPVFLIHGDRDDTAVPAIGAAELSAALAANGIGGAAPRRVTQMRPQRSDRYPVTISRYGSGRAAVVRAEVVGAGHATGPGGVTLDGSALDRQVVAFLLSARR